MERIVLAGACRTPIGKFGGSLKDVSAVKLGSLVIREAVWRSGISLETVDEVIMGCVLSGAMGQNVARQAAVDAGLGFKVPAMTVNQVCGSGLQAVLLAAAKIAAGEAEVVVAGGMENMSQATFALKDARFGYRMNNGQLIDTMVNDALWDAFYDVHMGVTAENVASQYGIGRSEQDAFAARSQQKCQAAREANRFDEEIVPVLIPQKKGEFHFDRDEYPRDDVTEDSIAGLKPAFLEVGTVTAANASGINDGAAALVVMSESRAQAMRVTPMAWLLAGATAGVDPKLMGLGPVPASRLALQKAGLSMGDIQLAEINEAFAAQVIAAIGELGIAADIVNVNGGAIALGHPVGASGCRILVTLLHEIRRRGLRFGLSTLCVGGGMGVAAVIGRE